MERNQEDQLQKELKALESLTKLRRQIEQEHEIIQNDLLAEVRAEREEALTRWLKTV
jgi:bacterioferritin (cytochrome b1)